MRKNQNKISLQLEIILIIHFSQKFCQNNNCLLLITLYISCTYYITNDVLLQARGSTVPMIYD